jgi:hypothetical protein
MSDPTEREAALLARCTPTAKAYLDMVRGQPVYPEVLTRLERTQGKLFEMDIERVFCQVIKEERALGVRQSYWGRRRA